MRVIQQFLFSKFMQEYDRLFLWVPVFFSFGIALYFGLAEEPAYYYSPLICLVTLVGYIFLKQYFLTRTFLMALFLIAAGFTASELRTALTPTKMLDHKIKDVELTGRIASVDLRPRDRRFVLEQVVFDNWPEGRVQPERIRLTLRHKGYPVQTGDQVRVKATLLPATGPIIEGAYDMAFNSYFEQIGATGYVTQPPIVLSPGVNEASLRQTLTHKLRTEMEPLTGAIAAALITGDRTGIPKNLRQYFADAGIAHILAISGLHLSIIAGLIFLIIRRGMCLIPSVALNWSTKKWAAFFSIIVTFGYLLLSGMATPAMRAFVMTSLVMLAFIFDRAALTLRNVAIAAMVILVVWPELLFHPSFQLSFAAVISLISAYEKYRNTPSTWSMLQRKLPRGLYYVGGISLTTLLASMATAPYAAYHFNRFAVHSIEANLIAIPLTSFWVMPAALVSVLAMPFGLERVPLAILSWGIDYLNLIASTIAHWPYSVWRVPQISAWVLGAFTLGVLWLVIWRSRWRWYGLMGPAVLVFMLLTKPIPDIFVSQRHGLIGITEGDILWVNATVRGWYVTENWQQIAGLKVVKSLEEHPSFQCNDQTCQGQWRAQSIVVSKLWGRAPRQCASVILSLSGLPNGCETQKALSKADSRGEGSYTYRDDAQGLTPLSKPDVKKRPWQS